MSNHTRQAQQIKSPTLSMAKVAMYVHVEAKLTARCRSGAVRSFRFDTGETIVAEKQAAGG